MSLLQATVSRRVVLALPLIGAACSGLRRGHSPEPRKLSRTAVLVAAGRAISSRDPDESTRNPDYLAEKLLTPADLEMIEDTFAYDNWNSSWSEVREHYKKQYGGLLANHSGFLPYPFLNLRTRHLDAAILDALGNGTEQIVVLGAGLDSRAYRLTNSWDAGRVFEVDSPSTQEFKKRKIKSVIGDLPPNLTFVPIDFTQESLREVLARDGYRSNAKTLMILEGVSMYLPKAAVESTLAFVARHAGPGSSIVFDYFDERLITQDHNEQNWKDTAKTVKDWGEPWIFGIPNSGRDNVFRFVAAQGLKVQNDFSMGELCVKYLPPRIMPATFGLCRWAWRICRAMQRTTG